MTLRLDQILGQSAAIAAIERAYTLDRLPHGLIFAGPAGVGKGTTAAALAKLFLCDDPSKTAPCGTCPACRAFDAGTHPDYHIVERRLIRLTKSESKARDLSIDVVRDYLVAAANMRAALNRGKVFIVEDADLMNPHAQNSLLKTLEEPAGRTLIILLTDQLDALLPTIRSRCQTIHFAALDQSLAREELQRRGIDPRAAAEAAAFSEGSLGVALNWIRDGVIDRARDLVRQLDSAMSGRGSGAALADWLRAAGDAYAEAQLKLDEKASKDQCAREGLTLYLKLAAQFFRRRLPDLGDDPDALERACQSIDAIVRAEQYLDCNVSVPLALQQLALTLEQTYAQPA